MGPAPEETQGVGGTLGVGVVVTAASSRVGGVGAVPTVAMRQPAALAIVRKCMNCLITKSP